MTAEYGGRLGPCAQCLVLTGRSPTFTGLVCGACFEGWRLGVETWLEKFEQLTLARG